MTWVALTRLHITGVLEVVERDTFEAGFDVVLPN